MSTQRKIIFVTQSFGQITNGPGTYTHYLWNSFLNDTDIDFHIVALNSSIQHDNIHTVKSTVTSSTSLLKSKRIYRAVADKAVEVAKQLGPDTIIHCNVCIYSSLLKTPYRIFGQINDYDSAEIYQKLPQTLKKFGLRRVLSLIARRNKERLMVRNQALTICNSDYTKEKIIELYKIKNTKNIVTIHKAVDLKQFEKKPSSEVKSSNQFELIFVGSNWRRKGLLTVLDALGGTEKNIVLTVIGPTDGDVNTILQPYADKLGLESRVRFVKKGSREDLCKLYWASDAFIMPSYDEAFGVVLLEAMTAELPVISTAVGGIPEIVNDSNVGLLIEPGNIEQCTQAILRLANDTEAYMQYRQSGLTRCQKFSTEVMIDKLKKTYLDVTIE